MLNVPHIVFIRKGISGFLSFNLKMQVMLKFIGCMIVYTSGAVAEMCLVYNYGNYKHRDCDSCCDSGIRRRCCSDTPDAKNSSTPMLGLLFGCLLGLMFLAGMCGTIAKYCHRRKLRSAQTSDPPPLSYHLACLDPTGLHDTHPKPPLYSARAPPPPYFRQDGPSRDWCSKSLCCSRSSHTGPVSQKDLSPPPYTPRQVDSQGQTVKDELPISHDDKEEDIANNQQPVL